MPEDNIKMIQQSKFTNITHLFYSGQYEQGEKQLTEIIKRESSNSNLYANHALFLSQLGQDQPALRQLQKALSINPRNYIAYFNVFSIQTRMMEDDAAFANLCCSLSCMYLIRARNAKSIEDASIAISYSNNNHEAHVLKGLLLLQKQKYEEARTSFEQALEFDPKNEVIRRLKKVAVQSGQLQEDEDIVIGNSEEKDYRLKSTYKSIDGSDLYEEIQSKLAEFNKLYVDINSTAGAVTQKVPKESNLLENRNSHIRSHHDDVKIIFDSGLSTPHKVSEMHPEPGNYYIQSSIEDEKGHQRSFVSCRMEAEEVPQESFLSINDDKQQSPVKEQLNSLEQNQGVQEMQQHFQSLISELKQEQFVQVNPVASQLLEQSQPQHLNIIYPLDDDIQLQISVLNLQFLQSDGALCSRLTDVYCIINYNNGKSKLKTTTKTCQSGTCTWNQQFQPVPISPSPSDMKIKIYNKRYTQVRDEYLGDLEVLITTADLLKLPVFSKRGILGHLLINLQLVPLPPATPPQQEDF